MIVLFSPLGLAYGSLYSAILLVRPGRVVVVSSRQAVVDLHSAVDAARFFHTSFEVETHLLDDPLAGFAEGRRLARRLAQGAGSHNVINLTGGTTALQDCVRSVADILRARNTSNGINTSNQIAQETNIAPHEYSCLVREVAVVDRRTAEEQKRVPLVVGELVEVPPL